MESKRVGINEDLLKVKSLIGKPTKRAYTRGVEDILVQLRDVSTRLDTVERRLKLQKDSSPAILKKKSQVVFVLKQQKQLTAAQLGALLKISRTRANEYLRGMEKDGILAGVTQGKKRYYMLRK